MFKLAPGQRTATKQGAPIEKESDGVNRWGGTKFAIGGVAQIAVSDRIQSI